MKISLFFLCNYIIVIIGDRMNIGVDIDDTITNTYETLLTIISMKYGLNHKKLISMNLGYDEIEKSLDNYDLYKKDLFSVMAKSVTLKENVVEILNKLRDEGNKIILITARNYEEYGEPYKVSIEFLEKNNIPYDELFVNVYEKGTFCKEKNIDIFIDDNVRNCNSVKDIGIRTVQFDTSFTPKVEDVEHVSSWNEFYELLHK